MKSGIGYEIENGGISYQGEFLEGKRSGKGSINYSDKAFYFGEWKNGYRHGYVNKFSFISFLYFISNFLLK